MFDPFMFRNAIMVLVVAGGLALLNLDALAWGAVALSVVFFWLSWKLAKAE